MRAESLKDPIVLVSGAGLLLGIGGMVASRWTSHAQTILRSGAAAAGLSSIALLGRLYLLREEPAQTPPTPPTPKPKPGDLLPFPPASERDALAQEWSTAGQDFARRVRPQQSTWAMIFEMSHQLRTSPTPEQVAELREFVTQYPQLRPIRGDGNCFYTAFAVSYITSVREGAIDCHPELVDQVNPFLKGDLEKCFQQDQIVLPLIEKVRELTAKGMRQPQFEHLSALEGDGDLKALVQSTVLKMGEEAEEYAYGPLGVYLGCHFSILRSDGKPHFEPWEINPEGEKELLLPILFKPGHYAVAYPATSGE